MEWIDVEKELPKSRKRYLAICKNGDVETSWTGLVDVYFDPHRGWIRCESKTPNLVNVTHYCIHPFDIIS